MKNYLSSTEQMIVYVALQFFEAMWFFIVIF